MKKHLTLLGVAAMATAVFAGCSNDEIVESYQGEEISFRTRTETRATETNLDNMGDFSVIAKGIHPSGDLYTAYLIGSQDETGVVTAEVASKAGESNNVWKLGRDVYWPSGMEQVLFWAYTTKQKNDQSTESIGTVKFELTSGPKVVGFAPVKADLTTTPETGKWNDGDNQKDLLVAFQEQKKEDGTSVSLFFQHALAQIDITAQQKGKIDTDNRIVKVKGAWIVNVNTKGDFSAGFTWNSTDKKAEEKHGWSTVSDLGIYGSVSSQPYSLVNGMQKILGNNGSLMIIPQKLGKWASDNTTGAYILLLCRIELEHDGTTHTGTTDDISIDENSKKHYHQLFPVADKYDSDMYGFSCVPLDIEWIMGKKYVYNLDICGATSGAGVYPPVIDDEMLNKLLPLSLNRDKIITKLPSGKNVGDPVLDEPIQFEVSVDEWVSTENPAKEEEIPLK